MTKGILAALKIRQLNETPVESRNEHREASTDAVSEYAYVLYIVMAAMAYSRGS